MVKNTMNNVAGNVYFPRVHSVGVERDQWQVQHVLPPGQFLNSEAVSIIHWPLPQSYCFLKFLSFLNSRQKTDSSGKKIISKRGVCETIELHNIYPCSNAK